MGLVSSDDGWRMPEWLWEMIDPLLPSAPSHPLGLSSAAGAERCCDGRDSVGVADGMQWNALSATGICSSSSAHRRFAGVGRCGRVLRDLAAGAVGVRRRGRDRLGVACLRRGDGQGAAGRGEDRPESH